MGLPLIDQTDESDEMSTEKSDMDVFYYLNTTYRKESDRPPKRFYGSRMWRAMELAISICKPGMISHNSCLPHRQSKRFFVENWHSDIVSVLLCLKSRVQSPLLS